MAHRTIQTPYGQMTRRQERAIASLRRHLEEQATRRGFEIRRFEVTVPTPDAYAKQWESHTVAVYAVIGAGDSVLRRDIYHVFLGVMGRPRSYKPDGGRMIASPFWESHRQVFQW